MEDSKTSIKRLQAKHIAIIIVIVIALVAYSIAVFSTFNGAAKTLAIKPVVQTVTTTAPVEPVAETAPIATEPVAETPVATETTSEPVSVQRSVTADPVVIPIPHQSVMAEAGISDSDQLIVAELLFDGAMWKQTGRYGVNVILQGSSPLNRFERGVSYVNSRYGSWTAALTQSQNNGGAW